VIAIACLALATWAVGGALWSRGHHRVQGPVTGAAAAGRPVADRRGTATPWITAGGILGSAVAAVEDVVRRRRVDVGLPEAVDAVAAAVAAGRSVVDGLELAAAASPSALSAELHSVVAAVGRGLPVAVAVERWAATSAIEGAGLVAAAVGLAGDAGGDVERALLGVAATLRERRALGREIRALSAQARISATTIAVAPLGFAAVAVAADGDTAGFLLGTSGGITCLALGLLLDLAGFRWMRRLAARVT
jgi:tight adherence protein B